MKITLENKIRKGIIIATSCLTLVVGGYFGIENYSYYNSKSSACNSQIKIKKLNLDKYNENIALSKEYMGILEKQKEHFRNIGHFPPEFDEPVPLEKGFKILDGYIEFVKERIKEINKDVEDTEKDIEELTQKREIHQKRRFNPFYKVFSKKAK